MEMVKVALGKMADFGERKENCRDWRHKKENLHIKVLG